MKKTTFADAFNMADEVLHSGVRGITDLITMPGLINLDFADIVSIMSKMGKAMMGTGEATGESRAIRAAESAISNPLLDNCSMKGAKGVLINITGGMDMTLFEVDEAANRIRDEVDSDANIIFGSTFNEAMEGTIRVSVVATGIESLRDLKGIKRTYSKANKIVAPPRPSANSPIKEQESNESQVGQSVATTAIDTEDHDDKSNRFIPPPAKEPQSVNYEAHTHNTTDTEEPNEEQEESIVPGQSTLPRRIMSRQPAVNNNIQAPSEQKMGLWSRVAHSMGLLHGESRDADEDKFDLDVEEDQNDAENSTPEVAETNRDDDTSDTPQHTNTSDEIVDVPAFLRRNKK